VKEREPCGVIFLEVGLCRQWEGGGSAGGGTLVVCTVSVVRLWKMEYRGTVEVVVAIGDEVVRDDPLQGGGKA